MACKWGDQVAEVVFTACSLAEFFVKEVTSADATSG